MQSIESKEHYLSSFRQMHSGTQSPQWLDQLRESAIESFSALGFPTTRNEGWKYTSVDPITAIPFGRANGQAKNVSPDELFSVSFTDFACSRLVFVNGAYVP